MKIHRFRCTGSYGYIVANWFERRYLRKRIAAGDTGIFEFKGWEPGPKRYGARFAITRKR